MALTYTAFQKFPLQIVGIDADYNAKIAAIEEFVVADLAYSGTASDITSVLPYFVFWFFCQDRTTTVSAETGENLQLKEFTEPAIEKQINAWNLGVEKLTAICTEKSTTVKSKYLSKISWL